MVLFPQKFKRNVGLANLYEMMQTQYQIFTSIAECARNRCNKESEDEVLRDVLEISFLSLSLRVHNAVPKTQKEKLPHTK